MKIKITRKTNVENFRFYYTCSLRSLQYVLMRSYLWYLNVLTAKWFTSCLFVCVSTDSTASIYVLRKGFSRLTQDIYLLPIEINDNGFPSMSSTNTLTIRVCSCDSKHNILSCNVEPYILPAGLSTGALIAILACIVILLGEKQKAFLWLKLYNVDSNLSQNIFS